MKQGEKSNTGEKIKKFFTDYFLIQAETALSIAIIGSIFAPDVRVGFNYFFLPAIIGLICMLPCIILYIKEDLSIWQIVLQRVIEWMTLEVAIEFTVYLVLGDVISKWLYLAVFFSVLIFDILTYVIEDVMESRQVDVMNEILAQRKILFEDDDEDSYTDVRNEDDL